MEPKFVTHQAYMSQGAWKAALSYSDHYWFWCCQIITSFQTKMYLLNWKMAYLTNCVWRSHSHHAPQPGGDRPAIFLICMTISPWENLKKPLLNMWLFGQKRLRISVFCDVRPIYLRAKMKYKTSNNSVRIMSPQTKQLPPIARWL